MAAIFGSAVRRAPRFITFLKNSATCFSMGTHRPRSSLRLRQPTLHYSISAASTAHKAYVLINGQIIDARDDSFQAATDRGTHILCGAKTHVESPSRRRRSIR